MVDESTALARRREELPAELPAVGGGLDILTLGKVLAQSGFFKDCLQEAQAVVKILRGQELGIGPATSMSEIHIVEGKPTLSASLMASLIKRSGRYDFRIRRADEEACELEFFERGESLGTAGFSLKEAARAGLAEKMNWRKYPADMCFARAMSRGAKRFCPDVFGGAVYTPDEIEVERPEHRPTPEVAKKAVQRHETAPSYAAATVVPETEEARRERAVARLRGLLTEVTERYLWDRDDLGLARWADYDFSAGTAEEVMEDAEALEAVLQIARRAEGYQQETEAAGEPVCEVCQKRLTSGQAAVSRGSFQGRMLCPVHQREAKEAARG